MKRTVLKSTVSSDGILHLALPLGTDAANKEVQVTVEPAPPAAMSTDEWHKLVSLIDRGRMARRLRAARTRGLCAAGAIVVSHLLDTNSWVDHVHCGPTSNVAALRRVRRVEHIEPGNMPKTSWRLSVVSVRNTIPWSAR